VRDGAEPRGSSASQGAKAKYGSGRKRKMGRRLPRPNVPKTFGSRSK